jgi:hypothetical protein
MQQHAAVETAQTQCLRDVIDSNSRLARKIGNGTRYTQHALMSARRQCESLHCIVKKRACLRVDAATLAQVIAIQLRIADA